MKVIQRRCVFVVMCVCVVCFMRNVVWCVSLCVCGVCGRSVVYIFVFVCVCVCVCLCVCVTLFFSRVGNSYGNSLLTFYKYRKYRYRITIYIVALSSPISSCMVHTRIKHKMRKEHSCVYPTVVMVTKAHQNPCHVPLTKDRGNCSGFLRRSCSTKQRK